MEELKKEIERLKEQARLAPKDDYNTGYLKALTNVTAIIDELSKKIFK